MIKKISLIAIAIGIAAVLISGTNHASAAAMLRAPQPVPVLSTGHGDEILRGSTGIVLKAGGESIILPLPQQKQLKEETTR
jgi:hypothetical protein